MNVVLLYSKYGMARFISSRDTVRAIERNLRRAKVPLVFSKGFHPHPIMSFLDSSPVGVVNRALYFSLKVESWNKEMFSLLKKTAARGLEPIKYWISDIEINSVVDSYSYKIILEKVNVDMSYLSLDSVIEKGKSKREYKLRELVEDFQVKDLKRYYVLKYTSKREKIFSPWEIVRLVKVRDGIFIPVIEEAMSGGKPLRRVLEG